MTIVRHIFKNMISLALALTCGVLLLLCAFLIDANLRDAALTAVFYSLQVTTYDFLVNGEIQNIFLLVAYLFRSIFISIIFVPLLITILIGEAVSAKSYVWYVCVTGRGEDLMILVKDFYESLTQFMDICKWLSLEPTLVQGRGGNVSVKSAGGLIIKSSGAKMADVNLYHGFCVCDILSSTLPKFVSDEDYSSYISASKKTGNHNPSMETGFHMSLPNRVVIHTHPIHLNALLCSKESETVIESINKLDKFF